MPGDDLAGRPGAGQIETAIPADQQLEVLEQAINRRAVEPEPHLDETVFQLFARRVPR